MKLITKTGGNTLIKKEYTILDTKKIKVVCLTLNDRGLEIFSSWNPSSRQELSFFDNNADKSLFLKLPKGYKFIGISYNEYDIILSLLRENINEFRNF